MLTYLREVPLELVLTRVLFRRIKKPTRRCNSPSAQSVQQDPHKHLAAVQAHLDRSKPFAAYQSLAPLLTLECYAFMLLTGSTAATNSTMMHPSRESGVPSTEDVNQPIILELQRASTLSFFSAKRKKIFHLIPQMGRRPIAKSVVFFKIGDGDHEIMTLKV